VFTRNLGPLQLKPIEFSILVLVASNQQVTQKQLGQALDVSPPNLAIMLDRMAGSGWVERVRSRADRRSQMVVLTRAGKKLAQQAERIASTMEDDALRVLSQAERMLLLELLWKVARGSEDS
jgi:DNA-binding MarR family transcriptional regulator